MAEGRRWPRERFEELAHDELATLVLFVAEQPFVIDGGFVDLDGEPVVLSETVGVAHPAELPREALLRWGERFSERMLRSPFDQLARPTRLPSEGESMALGVGPFASVSIRTVLEPRGYQLGEPDERLRATHLVRAFGDADPVAVLALDPGLGGSSTESRLTEAFFEARAPGGLSAGEKRIALGDVPARLRSEVLYDLSLLPR